MKRIKERDEIKKEDKWNIESIYQDKKIFYQELEEVKKELLELDTLKKDFLKDKEHFLDFLTFDQKVTRKIDKLYCYANLKNSEDMAREESQEMLGYASNLYQEYSEKIAFFTPMLLKEKKERILGFLEDDRFLSYHHEIDSILRYQGHTLSEKEEETLAAYSQVLSAGSDAASYLMDADMRFGTIKDEEGKEVELTQSNYSNYLMSKDRKVRKSAFLTLHEVYGSFKNTLTATLSSVVFASSTNARLNNFKSSIESCLYGNRLDEKILSNLVEEVHKNLPLLYRYFKIKKDLLHLDEFHLYDGYVSTVEEITKKYSFEEGKNLVLSALSVLGESYLDVLKTAFEDGWIDKYPNRGKTSGAFSSGMYDTYPFVLLNYTEEYDDVSTMAHELGHSMHSYFSNKNNSYTNAGYPIFLAEIASTVNELLFSHYMEKHAKTKEEKLAILNERLDMFKGTIFRQTMFTEFEMYLHEMVDKKEIPTADKLSEYYYNLNKQYFGEEVVVDDVIRYEWLRIPHFYRPFYVYQYATGLSIASYIAKNILEEKEGFKNKYLSFLKAGGSDYPLEILKIIDVDLTDDQVFQDAMEVFKETLDTFEKLSLEK